MDQHAPARTQIDTAARKIRQRNGRPRPPIETQRIALAAAKRLRKGRQAD